MPQLIDLVGILLEVKKIARLGRLGEIWLKLGSWPQFVLYIEERHWFRIIDGESLKCNAHMHFER